MSQETFYSFLPDGTTFTSNQAADIKTIYAPLCGSDASGLKSAITPALSGDIKIDKFHYVTKPAAREDLRGLLREFFVRLEDVRTEQSAKAGQPATSGAKNAAPVVSMHNDEARVYSIAQGSNSRNTRVEIGQLWHKTVRTHQDAGIEIEALTFIPSTNETVELTRVTVKNISAQLIKFTPTAAVPIFARSLANKHDHEHVTALLNRVYQNSDGVLVEPTMAFNEEGHHEIHSVYFVYGADDKNQGPIGTFPTVDSFYGHNGSLSAPQAVIDNWGAKKLDDAVAQGKEVVGALRFADETLKPGAHKSYIIAVGVAGSGAQVNEMFGRFNTILKFDAALDANQKFWTAKTASIQFESGDAAFNAWMRWVTIQPVLRRIFGCSFLPDHDYGKGGKGWRDLWQDLLSLILIEPERVREDLINNCAGIRIDGSNATIIGTKRGEFIADRNAITRVWMDHGCWPFLTIALYIHQTGDHNILFTKQTYFRDPQMSRTMEKDIAWVVNYGHKLLDKKGHVYEGTILEHLLVQNLTQFFNVGEHNIIRLESADWNDGLDMGFAKGESVAFTSFYGGNLLNIADMITAIPGNGKIRLAKELLILLDTLTDKPVNYDHAHDKRSHLFGTYFTAVQPALSGEYVELDVKDVAADLRKKGHWIAGHVRSCEKITLEEKGKTYQWFNGYYDNTGMRVEGHNEHGGDDAPARMTLTGQVFAIMSGIAHNDEIKETVASVDHFLRDKKLGGYRLNTNFGLRHYLDFGRAFGFAYGTKENGAFFSHMNVMYAYALYSRGFVREGHAVLNSIYTMSTDGEKSKIYPGIPEYFDSEGRGMYHYLTGSASWLVLTQLTQVFGVRGHFGDLELSPQLVKEQFDSKGEAAVKCQFAGHTIDVRYHNPRELNAGKYKVKSITAAGKELAFRTVEGAAAVRLSRALIDRDVVLNVTLAEKS